MRRRATPAQDFPPGLNGSEEVVHPIALTGLSIKRSKERLSGSNALAARCEAALMASALGSLSGRPSGQLCPASRPELNG